DRIAQTSGSFGRDPRGNYETNPSQPRAAEIHRPSDACRRRLVCDPPGPANEERRGVGPPSARPLRRSRAARILFRFRIRSLPGAKPVDSARCFRGRAAACDGRSRLSGAWPCPAGGLLESQVMPQRRILFAILIFTLLLGQTSQISAQKKFALTIDNIMRGP